jgi:hypothetical protein
MGRALDARHARRPIRSFNREFDMKLVSVCIAAAAMVPMFANAVAPGQYDISGRQQICLVDDGTWYSTTFSDWGGAYVVRASKTFIYGNYAEGDGNDSIALSTDLRGAWTEWRDDLSFQVVTRAFLTFVKAECDPPAAASASRDANPQDRR